MTVRFAVTGMERSGTTWLSKLLDQDPDVNVQHEPQHTRAWDARVLPAVHAGTHDIPYYVKARWNYWLSVPYGKLDRGEVNAMVRYAAAEIRSVWAVPVAAVVRDGRRTVRSLYKKRHFQRPDLPGIPPPAQHAQDPFACCCWYWADAYERLASDDIPTYRLKDLNTSYSTFTKLCEYLGVDIPRKAWKQRAGRPENRSIIEVGAAWKHDQWTPAMQATFDSIAGKMQAHHHYGAAQP